ncbi:Enolase, C-terminal TIM barrel domain, partial [Dillenia turbinata]
TYEALELRDGGKDCLGKGVLKLGANAILAVSLAVCKAGAMVKKIPRYKHNAELAGNKNLVLPVPAFNVINGGSHAGNKLAMWELFTLIGASSFKEAIKMCVEVYHNLEVVIGMDVAASEFYNGEDKTYDLNFKEEDDWEHYKKLTAEIGQQVQTAGDDLLATNPNINQIGSVTESIEALRMSKHAGWGVMASHRSSSETEDTFIADLSVGFTTGQIETGAPCRSDRLAKYN